MDFDLPDVLFLVFSLLSIKSEEKLWLRLPAQSELSRANQNECHAFSGRRGRNVNSSPSRMRP